MKYLKGKIDVGSHPGRIGCSQLAGALGVSDWKDASLNALLAFRGEPIPEPDEEAKERMELGTWYEDPTAKLAAKRLGLTIKRDPFAHWRADMPELICHPDRLIVGGFRGVKKVALEVKTASAFSKNWGDEWTDDIPTQYLMQCIGYVICGVAEAVLLAAFRSDKIKYYWVQPTRETVEQVARAFLKWLDNARNPEWMPIPVAPEDVKKQYPFLVKEGEKEASFELFKAVQEWRQIQSEISTLTALKEEKASQILLAMEGNKTLTFGGEKIASLVERKPSKTFNKELALKDFPQLSDDKYYKLGSSSVYLK